MRLPFFIGRNHITGAIVVFNFNLSKGSLRTKTSLKLAKPVATFGVIHAVAQGESDRIRTCFAFGQ